ncbi:MAG: hypothetical protein MUF38_18395 [Anaerolineae bacterium]|nr:hypothetical protein [Anaerolineae bacterium]
MAQRAFLRMLIVGMLLMGITTTALMQPLTCPEQVAQALEAAHTACADLAEGEACYGNPLVSAVLTDPDLIFEEPGDRVPLADVESITTAPYVPLADVESITTAPYDDDTGEWSIAYVYLTDDEGVAVRLMLFGDVALTNDPDDGLSLAVAEADDDGCDGAPSGVFASAPDGESTIIINGEEFEIDGLPLGLTFPDGEATLLEGGGEGVDSDWLNGLLDAYSPPASSSALDIQTFESTSSTPITPAVGLWVLESTSATLIEACEGEYTDKVRGAPNSPASTEFDFSGGFSAEEYLLQQVGRVLEADYDNPAPNIYTAETTIGGAPAYLTLTVVSETEIIYSFVHRQVYCYVQLIEWWEFAGD